MRDRVKIPAKHPAWPFLKFLVSLGTILLLLWIVDWQRAGQVLGNVRLGPLCLAPLLSLAGVGIGAARWSLLMGGAGFRLPVLEAYRGYLYGWLYNLFLPSALGGDVIRVGFAAKRSGCGIGPATVVVLTERILGLAATGTLLVTGALLFPHHALRMLAPFDDRLPLLLSVVGGACLFVFFGAAILLRGRAPGPGRPRTGKFFDALSPIRHLTPKLLPGVILLSLCFQFADILMSLLLAKALGLNVDLTVFLLVLPVVYLVTALPISLGGLGLREGSLAFLLSRFGILASDGITLSFLILLARMFVGGIGGLLQLQNSLKGGGERPPGA